VAGLERVKFVNIVVPPSGATQRLPDLIPLKMGSREVARIRKVTYTVDMTTQSADPSSGNSVFLALCHDLTQGTRVLARADFTENLVAKSLWAPLIFFMAAEPATESGYTSGPLVLHDHFDPGYDLAGDQLLFSFAYSTDQPIDVAVELFYERVAVTQAEHIRILSMRSTPPGQAIHP